MKMIAPNIAMPIVAPIALATLKTLERKSVSGMIGSAARRSCQTKATSSSDAGDAERRRSSASPRRTRCRPRS